MRIAAHPSLYDPTDQTPSLAGSRCAACGRIAFPPITIGCDVCGAEESSLKMVDLEAFGQLYSFATVHHQRDDLETPFTIGEIQLKNGPLIRATIASGQPDLKIGQRMRAVWHVTDVDDRGQEVVEPVFEVEQA
jgi:uncharacterized OB-fold protein